MDSFIERNLINTGTGLIKALPFLILITGMALFVYSVFGEFQSPTSKELCNGLGKILISSAVFTFLVKSYQFTRIFREELTNIIFEPKYLSNRSDLPMYWGKVSQELCKNKFPNINDKLLRDISEKYLPTNHVMYYDDVEHLIDIEVEDAALGFIKVTQTIKLTAIPYDKNETFFFEFGNYMPYVNDDQSDVHYSSAYVKVNNVLIDGTKIVEDKSIDIGEKAIIHRFKTPLSGSDKYLVER